MVMVLSGIAISLPTEPVELATVRASTHSRAPGREECTCPEACKCDHDNQ